MRARNDKRSCGQSSRSAISVGLTSSSAEKPQAALRRLTNAQNSTGSRYVYELYYEKEAISKQLYEWLLKNGYADANLIAKWKKQGYEKVGTSPLRTLY